MQCRNCCLNDYKRLGVYYCILPRCPYPKDDCDAEELQDLHTGGTDGVDSETDSGGQPSRLLHLSRVAASAGGGSEGAALRMPEVQGEGTVRSGNNGPSCSNSAAGSVAGTDQE